MTDPTPPETPIDPDEFDVFHEKAAALERLLMLGRGDVLASQMIEAQITNQIRQVAVAIEQTAEKIKEPRISDLEMVASDLGVYNERAIHELARLLETLGRLCGVVVEIIPDRTKPCPNGIEGPDGKPNYHPRACQCDGRARLPDPRF